VLLETIRNDFNTPLRRQPKRGLMPAAMSFGDDDGLTAELHAHCYRMLGSLQDADDALQEALLRAWRGIPRFEGRSALRSWLYTIATNACLDAIARRPKRVLPIDHGPPAKPGIECVGLAGGYAAPEARYEQREAVELAFVAALQHLSGIQRAVLILREVIGFSAREVAESLETTVASVNSELAEAFTDAGPRGDVEAVRALLAEDAVFGLPRDLACAVRGPS